MNILPQEFFNRSPLLVAPDLLGKILVRFFENNIISGRIVETEAYLSADDEAAHSYNGMRKSNASLYKHAGHGYIHQIHRYFCFDVVTEEEGIPSSVLIRALEPLEGIEFMRKFRNKDEIKDLASGPGKLSQALNITREQDGINLTKTDSIIQFLDDGWRPERITVTKRIGITKASDKDYRFYIKNSSFISKK